jgi:chromate reductase
VANDVKILGISGSLRQKSFNTAALRAAAKLLPPDATMETFDIRPIPIYDDDLRAAGFPAAVADFRARIAAADAVLIVTPEYNYSIPGPLKNAIDWASRPPDQPFNQKPIAVMGASPGIIGTARAQYHLRQSFVFLNAQVINKPEVMIGGAASKFDAEGNLTDATTEKFIRDLLAALADWTRRMQAAAKA